MRTLGLMITLMVCVGISVNGTAAEYRVSDTELSNLATDFETFRRNVVDDLNKISRAPRDRNGQRIIQDAVQSIEANLGTKERNLVRSWINAEVKGSGSQGSTVTKKFTGFFIISGAGTTTEAKAQADLDTECENQVSFFKSVLGENFHSYPCGGSSQNISRVDGWFTLKAQPTLTVKLPDNARVGSEQGRKIISSMEQTNPYSAYETWWESCKKWIDAAKEEKGDSFIAAECGVPSNNAKVNGWYSWSSQGVVYFDENQI